MNVYVKDENGEIYHPWLMAWHDVGSGRVVGWCLTRKPCKESIACALGAAKMELPAVLYIDNGKDYRDATHTYRAIMPEAENVKVAHALPYRSWANTTHRFYHEMEQKLKGIPKCITDRPDRPGELPTLGELTVVLKDLF